MSSTNTRRNSNKKEEKSHSNNSIQDCNRINETRCIDKNKNNYNDFENINNKKSNSDSIDEDEEKIGNINSNKNNDYALHNNSKNHKQQIFSKEFCDELNFYASPSNSKEKKTYFVSELNQTSNTKGRDSNKQINLSSKNKNEILNFSNYSQSNLNNTNAFNSKKLDLTDVINSPNNLDNSEVNKLNFSNLTNHKTVRSGFDINEKKTNNNKNLSNNSMSNNIHNSRSTNNNSESHITSSNAYKKITLSKNKIENSISSKKEQDFLIRKNLKSTEERDRLKNYANSFIEHSPSAIDYTSNKINFNYNSNNKSSPRYDNKINQSAFINGNYNYNDFSNSHRENDTSKYNTANKNFHIYQTDFGNKNNISKSNLSPNSQKKINYFNTDICDISLNRKPKHNILDKGIPLNNDKSLQETAGRHSNKIRVKQKSNENEEEEFTNTKANLSSRNLTSDYNAFKTDCANYNYKSNKKNSFQIEFKNKIELPQTLHNIKEMPTNNFVNKKTSKINSDFVNDETNITNYYPNLTGYNENFDLDGFNDSYGNSHMNNTMTYTHNTNGNCFENLKRNKNIQNNSYFSERNNVINKNRNNFKATKNNYNICVSPQSVNGANMLTNKNGKKINRNLQHDYSTQKNYNDGMASNITYIDTLYYGGENSTLNRTQISGISSKSCYINFYFPKITLIIIKFLL